MMGTASEVWFTVQGNNTTPWDQNPVKSYGSFDTAIGAQWLIQPQMIAQPSQWDPHPCNMSIAEVDYMTPNSLSLNSQADSVSNPIRFNGAAHTLYDWTYQDNLGGYLDEHTGVEHFSIDIKYNNHGDQQWPDDVFNIDLNVMAPKGTLNTTFPPPSGQPGAFHFGAWQTETMVNGQYVTTNTPIAWNDPGLIGAKLDDPREYRIGAQSPGLPAVNDGDVNFAAHVQNVTPVNGYFSINQVATFDATNQDIGTNNFVKQISTYDVHSPRDANGNQIWGQDEWIGSDMQTFRLLVHPGESADLTNPNADYNYFDNPCTLYSPGTDSNRFIHFMDYHLKLETELVWTPYGGFPLVISKQPWSIDVHYDNQAVRDNPTEANMLNPDNWVGHADMLHDPAIQNVPQVLPSWQYNVPVLLDISPWVPQQYQWNSSSQAIVQPTVTQTSLTSAQSSALSAMNGAALELDQGGEIDGTNSMFAPLANAIDEVRAFIGKIQDYFSGWTPSSVDAQVDRMNRETAAYVAAQDQAAKIRTFTQDWPLRSPDQSLPIPDPESVFDPISAGWTN